MSLIRVSKNLMLKRVMLGFSVEVFFVSEPKNFVEEPFYAVFLKNSGIEKVYG